MQRYSLANGSKRKLMLRKPLGRWTTQPTQDWSTYIQLEGENLWVLDKNTKQWKVFTNKSQGLHTQRSRNSIPTQTAACAGPVDGDSSQNSSTRAELF